MEQEKNKVSLDIYDLCSILNTVGFVVIDEEKFKQVRSCGRKIQVICNVSGKKVYLESVNSECFCWRHIIHDDIEKWEMSGTSGGVATMKMESSITSWKELPKNVLNFIEKTVESLVDIVRGTTNNNSFRERRNSSVLSSIDARLNKIKSDCNLIMDDNAGKDVTKSSLAVNVSGVDKLEVINDESEILHRSLDTLTKLASDPILPEPGVLDQSKKSGIVRQYTYTTSPTKDELPPIMDIPARTSSPVPSAAKCAIKKLLEAERLSSDLADIIQEAKKIIENDNGNPGLSPYSAIDVSKISQSKGCGDSFSSKRSLPYASSPNLSMKRESKTINTNLKRIKSTSVTRVSSLNVPTVKPTLQKSSSLKRTIPRLSNVPNVSPTFGSGRKSLGAIVSGQLPGSYKPIGEKTSLSFPAKEGEMKKRSSLYSHIKPTIQRYTSRK